MRLLRVGRISALNMYPIYHGLERAADPTLAFTDGVPSELNRALIEGRLDVSAMSSIAYARNAARLRLVPVASITANGAVDSIQLFSRVPFDEVRTVAVTPHSETSVALLRVLLGPSAAPFATLEGRSGRRAGRRGRRPADRRRGPHRAARAVRRAPHRPRARCGASAPVSRWSSPCGPPGRRSRASARTRSPPSPACSRRRGRRYLADPEAVVAAAAERFPFPADFIRPYLRRLRYEFGSAERAGLETFLEQARACGELDVVPRLAA